MNNSARPVVPVSIVQGAAPTDGTPSPRAAACCKGEHDHCAMERVFLSPLLMARVSRVLQSILDSRSLLEASGFFLPPVKNWA